MWVPIALSRDVPKGVTRAVIVDGDEFVVWRGEAGTVQVWEDRCPHRGMRLSFGFVRGDGLNCLYHGWEYGAGASCIRIPAHPDLDVPPTIRANVCRSAETGGMIWMERVNAGGSPLPLAGRPIASVAVAGEIGTVLELCDGAPRDDAQLIETRLDGLALAIGWHVPGPGRLILHAVALDPGDVETQALLALHRLRARAEAGRVA